MERNKYLSLIFIIFVMLISTFLSGCSSKQTLLFLNWGEYINEDLIEKFEEEYNCTLIVDIADSNELFYSKLKSGTTAYDLCCPADYMVEKMYLNGLIQEIDFSKLENFAWEKFMDGVLQIEAEMDETMKEICAEQNRPYRDNEINYYHMPYYWGTFGLQYNRRNPIFEDKYTYDLDGNLIDDTKGDGNPDILQRNNAWDVYMSDPKLPESEQLPANTRIGMYNAARFCYGYVMQYYAGTPNASPKVTENIEAFKEIISRRKFTEWSNDQLKHSIEAGNLDIAFTYTGDCLDMTYIRIKENSENFEDLDFYVYVPKNTPAHVDTLVIPANSRHLDLAHKFLDFLLEPENSWLNTRDVGYCPPLQEVYDMIVNDIDIDENGPVYMGIELDEEEIHWRRNWAKAMMTTFPIDENGKSIILGTPMSYFENEELKLLNNIINNVKSK